MALPYLIKWTLPIFIPVNLEDRTTSCIHAKTISKCCVQWIQVSGTRLFHVFDVPLVYGRDSSSSGVVVRYWMQSLHRPTKLSAIWQRECHCHPKSQLWDWFLVWMDILWEIWCPWGKCILCFKTLIAPVIRLYDEAAIFVVNREHVAFGLITNTIIRVKMSLQFSI